MDNTILQLVEEEGRLADKNNSKEEEYTRYAFEHIQFVSQDDDREDHSDDGAGKDDTQGIRDWHEADTGKTGDEVDGSC